MADLTTLLLRTQDPNTRAEAEAQIKAAETQNVEEYFKALASELAGDDKPKIARQLSGLLLKNALAAKDPHSAATQALKARWCALPSNTRDLVKQATTKALITQDLDVGKAAAQVLGKIGSIEIPPNEWPGLVPLLLQHVTNQDARARQIALVCLGYLCEDLVALSEEGTQVADEICNHILTAVAQGMRDADVNIKLEATRAFYHAVVLAHKNFGKQNERDFIMQVVTDACNTQDSEAVQAVAFECLVQIATEYYQFLMAYMPVIGELTLRTIRGTSQKVAMPAMEFWSTVCDEELYVSELVQTGQQGEKQLHNIIQQALPHLVPLLTEMLTKQESEEDDDTWNLAMAAGSCLGLVAQVVGDQCVDLVLQFVQSNFENPDWRFREAAILAYGSIMEGPSSDKMRPLAAQTFQPLVQRLGDQSIAVRDTLAWTLGRIAQFHPSIVPVKELTPVLGQALQDNPRVASNICWVLQVLAENMTQTCLPGQAPETTPLSEFFTSLAQAIIGVTMRPDATERNLRMSAYESLAMLVSKAGNDCLQYMGQLVDVMLQHLSESFKVMDKECELQGYICGVLNALVTRLRQQVAPKADQIMEAALQVFSAYQQVRGGAQVLHEEALMLVQTIIYATERQFDKYMPLFAIQLKVGLENYEDVQVCVLSVGILGDVGRCLQKDLLKYCDTFLEILYRLLVNEKVDRKIKASIMPVFGDVALSIAGDFEKYLPPVLEMLSEASKTRLPPDITDPNDEWVEYLNSLREGVMTAYTGIIHGLRDAGKLELFKAHVNNVITLVQEICNDRATNEEVMKATLGVIGDVVMAFQQELVVFLQTPAFAPCLQNLVQFASRSSDHNAQRTGQWLQSLLQRYSSGTFM